MVSMVFVRDVTGPTSTLSLYLRIRNKYTQNGKMFVVDFEP